MDDGVNDAGKGNQDGIVLVPQQRASLYSQCYGMSIPSSQYKCVVMKAELM
jgi:hypothetical protein